MSNMLVFFIKDRIDYDKMNSLSKKIINYCLSKNIGVIFNFLGYNEKLINEFEPTLYFSISDDFLQLNSEYLSTAKIENITSKEGEKAFYKRFSFLNEIYDILINSSINKISLMISTDGSIEKLKDLNIINIIPMMSITEMLYNAIIDNAEKHAYDFPDILINF